MLQKALAVLLCAVLCLSPLGALSALAEEPAAHCDCGYTPIVYIVGRSTIFKTTDDDSDANKAEGNLSGGTGSVAEAVAHVVPLLTLGLTTNIWGPYCDAMFDELSPVYDQYALNDDGELDNESGLRVSQQPETLIAAVRANGRDFHIRNRGVINAYEFRYDMRLDPRVVAEQFNEYIEAVREVTGHDKVNIVARCEGTVITNAYFHLHSYDAVERVILYNSISSGAEIADDMFSSRTAVNVDAINVFFNQYLDSTPVMDFIKAAVNAAAYNGSLKLGMDAVKYIYDKIAPDLMPRLIRAIFGTCPGWWSMISPEKVEECKAFVLEGNPDGRFDKLIEKIDGYNEMKKDNRGMLERMTADGVMVYVFAKYGNRMYPVVESADNLGDEVASLYRQTYCGATTSDFSGTLSEDYIAAREAEGFGRFISADKKVDASTAFVPEHTWIYKELPHKIYPIIVHTQMMKILRYDGYATVDTFEDIPQFQLCRGANHNNDKSYLCTAEPLTAENAGVTTNTADTSSFLKVVRRLLDTLKTLLKTWLSQARASLTEKD